MRVGFITDKNNSQLKNIFEDSKKIKKIHIDIYSENPLEFSTSFMLLLRMSEKNVTVLNDGHRLILKRNDKFETYLVNILLSKITECFCKITENYSEFIINIQNIYYRITVLN